MSAICRHGLPTPFYEQLQRLSRTFRGVSAMSATLEGSEEGEAR